MHWCLLAVCLLVLLDFAAAGGACLHLATRSRAALVLSFVADSIYRYLAFAEKDVFYVCNSPGLPAYKGQYKAKGYQDGIFKYENGKCEPLDCPAVDLSRLHCLQP